MRRYVRTWIGKDTHIGKPDGLDVWEIIEDGEGKGTNVG